MARFSLAKSMCNYVSEVMYLHKQFGLALEALSSLGPDMKVCLTFGFLLMLRQSNLAPPSSSSFDHTRHI